MRISDGSSDVCSSDLNSPNAPVSYPFLWDATRSDFVQWNGVASNALLGPLGRNTGEVIGVFAILDWHEDRGIFADLKRFNLSAWLSGQSSKQRVISFQSSAALFNLRRLEAHPHQPVSPRWPFFRNSDEHTSELQSLMRISYAVF